jgi:hypothetical protein
VIVTTTTHTQGDLIHQQSNMHVDVVQSLPMNSFSYRPVPRMTFVKFKKKGEVEEMEEADRNVSVSPLKDAPIFRRRKLLLNSQEYYIK